MLTASCSFVEFKQAGNTFLISNSTDISNFIQVTTLGQTILSSVFLSL